MRINLCNGRFGEFSHTYKPVFSSHGPESSATHTTLTPGLHKQLDWVIYIDAVLTLTRQHPPTVAQARGIVEALSRGPAKGSRRLEHKAKTWPGTFT